MTNDELDKLRDHVTTINRHGNNVKDILEQVKYTLRDHRNMGEMFSAADDITKACTELQQHLHHMKRKHGLL